MITIDLDAAIKASYEYAHNNCKYGPTDRTYPPMEDGNADCCGLVFRALYLLNINKRARNINEIISLCELAGMKRSDNINDVFLKHCVVILCPNNDTKNVSHVYYSLGGKSLNDISKYDLGSDKRIKATQPFNHVHAIEWSDKKILCCYYYVDDDKLPCNDIIPGYGVTGKFTKNSGVYDGAGVTFTRIASCSAGETCVCYPIFVTSSSGNVFRFVRIDKNVYGYVYHNNVAPLSPPMANRCVVSGTDGFLNVRAGVGITKEIVGKLKENDIVTAVGEFKDSDDITWTNVQSNTLCGFVCSVHLRKMPLI